ncbi:MAG: hypothetical protein ACRESZ_08005 [Methylococcales bacterium]
MFSTRFSSSCRQTRALRAIRLPSDAIVTLLLVRSTSCGIKDSPPYLHDGRLLTLDDTVEFFSIVLELNLNAREKQDLVSFFRAL